MPDLRDDRMEPKEHYRVPSQYDRCRRPRCQQPPVTDLNRNWWKHGLTNFGEVRPSWWAYCADHLRDYNREVRDGHVWWIGVNDEVRADG